MSKVLILCLMKILSPREWLRLFGCWWFWRRPSQTAPVGAWRTWIFLGGRGAGKTRAGAEWVREQIERGGRRRVALIGPTFHDVREVMIDGPSGLRSLCDSPPVFEATRRRLVWPNGAEAHALSAADPESLRGPQFDAAWADEFCAWDRPDETWSLLTLGLRLGQRPQAVVTTTPRPIAALRRLLSLETTRVTRDGTRANAAFLAPGFVEEAEARWGGTRYGRQELDGELIDDPEGALWRRATIEAARLSEAPEMDRLVVAVDPPAGIDGDACGIVAAGSCGEGENLRGFVLTDASVKGLTPLGWARRVAETAEEFGAAIVVAEANNGGEMVRTVLNSVAPHLVVQLVRAQLSKRRRAEPISILYEQRKIEHVGAFHALEDEMCTFGAPGFSGSPDRLDALVWAMTYLMLSAGPRARSV
jgi:phage terminase large subunit-like protein